MAVAYVETFNVVTDPTVTDDHRAVINDYRLTVRRTKDDRFEVTNEAYRTAFKGRGGKYAGKDLTVVLNDAVYDHKKLMERVDQVISGEADPALQENVKGDAPDVSTAETQSDTSNNKKTRQRKKDAPAAHTEAPDKVAAEPAEKKARVKKVRVPKVRKDNRYLRCARIVAKDLTLVPSGLSGKAWLENQERLAAEAGNLSVASAGHFFEAWVNITKVLTENGWLKLPKTEAATG